MWACSRERDSHRTLYPRLIISALFGFPSHGRMAPQAMLFE